MIPLSQFVCPIGGDLDIHSTRDKLMTPMEGKNSLPTPTPAPRKPERAFVH